MSRDHLIPIGEVHYLRTIQHLSAKALMGHTYCGLMGNKSDHVDDAFGDLVGNARFRAVSTPKHVTCRNCRKHGGLVVV